MTFDKLASVSVIAVVLLSLATDACSTSDSSSDDSTGASGGTESPGGTSTAGQALTGGAAGGAAGEAAGEAGTAGHGGALVGGADSGLGAGGVAREAGGAGDGGTTLEPGVAFIGRFDFTVPDQPSFAWSASAIEARFTGTQVSVTLNVSQTAFFDLLIDGQIQPVVTPMAGSHSVSLAANLPNGTHDVVLVRRDEAYNGVVQFQGFDFGPGGTVLPHPRLAHRIEVVGDSITAGYGNECPPYDNANGVRENAYLAWGPLAARNLGAEVHVEAKSGIALSAGNPTMPQIWSRTLPEDAASKWSFTQWIPDAIVINLGSNDWFFGGDPSVAFRADYIAFLAQVRSVYPNAYILCALGPMLKDPGLSQQRAALNSAISARNTAGDTNIGVLEFPVDNGSLGYGCAGHPSVAEDAVMATALEQALRKKLGW